MNPKNIVVVFITAKHSRKAFNYGMGLAKKFEARLTVLNILYKEPPRFGFFETKCDKKCMEKRKAEAEKLLEEYEKSGIKSGITTKTHVVFSDPISKGILSYVNERDVDLVILDHPKITRFEESYFANTVCDLHKGLKTPLLLL
jgi:nucleotide-binding universal stress UspA family protein